MGIMGGHDDRGSTLDRFWVRCITLIAVTSVNQILDQEMLGDCQRLELCLQIALCYCDMMTQSPLTHRSTTPRFPEDCKSFQIVLQSLVMSTVDRRLAATMIAYYRLMISRKAFHSEVFNRAEQTNRQTAVADVKSCLTTLWVVDQSYCQYCFTFRSRRAAVRLYDRTASVTCAK